MSSTFNFQELPKNEAVIPVSALNQAVAKLLERNFPLTWVSGEISNFTRATSGHWYFTLKDSSAQVRAVMFRGRAQYAGFIPREGDKVEVRALVGLYAPRGDYQINVEAIRRAGVGNLYEAFVQLKAKLAAEGLFDSDRKKPIPRFVKRIGIITSPNAAALRDVITALERRAPHIEILIYPCPVQGEGAATKIAQMLALADSDQYCDVLIVCRGGGSIEDLWAFNDELLALTIAHCELPIISGVGHETDFTITDFVADLRAPTPTAAAELAATPRKDWLADLQHYSILMQRQMRRQLDTRAQHIDWFSQRLQSPTATLATKYQQINHYRQRLGFAVLRSNELAQSRLRQLDNRLLQRRPNVREKHLQLESSRLQIRSNFNQQLSQRRAALKGLQDQLELLNPQRTLERGYAILQTADGELIRSADQISAGSSITLRTAHERSALQIASVSKLKSAD